MLRITIEKATTETLFIFEGRLAGLWVTELHNVVMTSHSMPDLIYLDLTDVHFVDEQGLTLLRELMAWGVILRAVSPFIQELLKTR
jgi:anti-anti-sigma regulatory factor